MYLTKEFATFEAQLVYEGSYASADFLEARRQIGLALGGVPVYQGTADDDTKQIWVPENKLDQAKLLIGDFAQVHTGETAKGEHGGMPFIVLVLVIGGIFSPCAFSLLMSNYFLMRSTVFVENTIILMTKVKSLTLRH